MKIDSKTLHQELSESQNIKEAIEALCTDSMALVGGDPTDIGHRSVLRTFLGTEIDRLMEQWGEKNQAPTTKAVQFSSAEGQAYLDFLRANPHTVYRCPLQAPIYRFSDGSMCSSGGNIKTEIPEGYTKIPTGRIV